MKKFILPIVILSCHLFGAPVKEVTYKVDIEKSIKVGGSINKTVLELINPSITIKRKFLGNLDNPKITINLEEPGETVTGLWTIDYHCQKVRKSELKNDLTERYLSYGLTSRLYECLPSNGKWFESPFSGEYAPSLVLNVSNDFSTIDLYPMENAKYDMANLSEEGTSEIRENIQDLIHIMYENYTQEKIELNLEDYAIRLISEDTKLIYNDFK